MPNKRTLGRVVRVLTLAATAFLPGPLKKAMLRRVFGFRIGQRVRIGIAYFDCAELSIEDDASIGDGVAFKNVGSVRVGDHAVVGPLNLFRGGDRIELDDYSQLLRLNVINAIPQHDCFGVLDSTFVLGYGAVVSSSHWIDFTDRVSIGRRSMLGGRNSSIWTHNRRRAAPVRIGDFCYMGSEIRIAPGVTIADCTVLALGSVVSSSITSSFMFIGGSPARVARRLTEADADTLFGKTRWDLPDEPVPVIPAVAVEPAGHHAHRPLTAVGMETVDAEVRRIVAEAATVPPEEIAGERSLIEQGIDSLQLIVLREMLEIAFDVHFSDDEWLGMTTPAQIARFLRDRRHRPGFTVRPAAPSIPASRATNSAEPSVACVDLQIGMPLTGRNNLAETPLLQWLGDQRWRHISDRMGIPTRQIVDEVGERLYATFFYVEMAFPPERPMASFGENDHLRAVSSIARYGTSMVDGVSYLMPGDHAVGDDPPFAGVQDAVAAGIPAVRLSNIFVKQFAGAEWLKKGRPAHPGFVRIPSMAQAPDSYAIVKRVEKAGHFGRPASAWIPMTNGPVRREYRLIPDRDLNGAGLVYFANYPMFLDICERDVLLTANLALSEALVDRRTLVYRRSAYLNNASSRETLLVDVEPWLELSHPGVNESAANAQPFIVHINCRMYRRSDDRLMMVSTAQKVIAGASMEDLPFARHLASPLVNVIQRPN
jgi:probable biosynthetic protein (TIGR04098 family)